MSCASGLPGCLLILGACVILALVSFNTPLLKTFYFLEANFANGDYAGSLRLGTLGYCLTQSGSENCVGPQVGYNFDLNTILNVKLFNIPSVISKALTYTLILHPIALAFAVISLIAGLFDLIPGFSVLCFPTCFAGIAGGITLIAFIFDLAIFFIAKSRIGSVSGASANVGAAVWMTLAAWLLCGFAGCAWGLAGCCCCGGGGRRDNNNGGRRRRDREMDDYNRDTDMRLQALRDDQRRQKEQDLPNFQPYERVPQKEDHEDKYLYDESAAASQPRPLRRDGSVLQGVGVGYGRKQGTPQNGYAGGPNDYGYGQQGLAPQRQPSTGSSYMTAGAAGVGAGGGGVDQPHRGGHDYNQNQGYEEFNDNYNYNQGQGHGDYYNDPYGQQQQQQHYNQQGYNDPYGNQQGYAPQAAAPQGGHEYYGAAAAAVASRAPASADSHGYHDPGPQVNPADPYHHAYEDDGLGGIGRAATSPAQEREYTGHQGFGYTTAQQQGQPPSPIQVPTPQHLVNPQQSSLLNRQHSVSSDYGQGQEHIASPTGYGTYVGGAHPPIPPPVQMPTTHEVDEAPRPPSYGQVAGASTYQPPPEKSSSAVRQ